MNRDFIKFAESRFAYILFAILVRVQLEYGYVNFVAPLFGYAGFVLDFSSTKYVESWAIYLFAIFLAPRILVRPSDYLMTFLIVGLLLPVLVIYALANKSRLHFYIFVFGCLLVEVFRRGRLFRLPVVHEGQKICVAMLISVVLIVTGWYIASGGLGYFNLDLSKVYDLRDDVAEVTNVGLMAYINGWAPKVAGPALLAYFLWKKKNLLAIAVVFLHVLWFGVSAHKSVLFYPFLILFLWFWFQKTRALSFVYFGVFSVLSVGLVLYFWKGDILISSLFMRRVFFVVGDLVFQYYDFFSDNERVYWSNSVLSSVFRYPYHVTPAVLIGEAAGTEANANATFLATGYMHAGFGGVVLYGILAGLLFRVIDSVSARGLPIWVSVSVIIVSARSLILSADLPTAMLTHGVGFAILILFLMRVSSRPATRGNEISAH